jgi:hypothetical protein
MESDVFIDSETFLVTDFMNLKIKPTQSFRCAHRDRKYVYVFIRMSAHTYINICVSYKKKSNRLRSLPRLMSWAVLLRPNSKQR